MNVKTPLSKSEEFAKQLYEKLNQKTKVIPKQRNKRVLVITDRYTEAFVNQLSLDKNWDKFVVRKGIENLKLMLDD